MAERGNASRSSKGFDALIGNMPFLGGRRIAGHHGADYAAWLTQVHGGTGGTDYVGYFFLRAGELVPARGAVGFIATDAVADGDSRRTTLARVVSCEQPMTIYHADTAMWWPGSAAVLIAVIHLARGPVAATRAKRLNGRTVDAISSRLRAGRERLDPIALADNDGFALVGCFLRGDGFILAPDEAAAFVEAHPDEAEVIKPYLVGNDLNSDPAQVPSRFVVSFEDRELEEAQRYTAAFELVAERVRPHRQRLKSSGADAEHKKYWWRFANTRRELRAQLASLERVLATARVSKHVAFSLIPAKLVPSEQVVIFPVATYTAFAVLQSRIHGFWVRLLAGARGEGVRYSASECFAPFPFPQGDPSRELPELEAVGQELYEARATAMQREQVGLTELYNRLLDPSRTGPVEAQLRTLHERLDASVARAYGFRDLAVPPFCPLNASGTQAVEQFHDEVLDRLMALNVERASGAAEAARSPGVQKARTQPPGIARATPRRDPTATPSKRKVVK